MRARQLGLAQLTLALALAQSGDGEGVPTRWRAPRPRRSMRWTTTGVLRASGIIRATAAARRGDVDDRRRHGGGRVRRHADAIGYDAFRVRACCWRHGPRSAEGTTPAALETYRGALELARRVGFGDHAAFALAGLGTIALAGGDLHEAERLQRQAVATADAAGAPWAAARARVQLARIAAAAGEAETAERLYREVIDWSQAQRPHHARESLFLALAGSPATEARLGLAEGLALT